MAASSAKSPRASSCWLETGFSSSFTWGSNVMEFLSFRDLIVFCRPLNKALSARMTEFFAGRAVVSRFTPFTLEQTAVLFPRLTSLSVDAELIYDTNGLLQVEQLGQSMAPRLKHIEFNSGDNSGVAIGPGHYFAPGAYDKFICCANRLLSILPNLESATLCYTEFSPWDDSSIYAPFFWRNVHHLPPIEHVRIRCGGAATRAAVGEENVSVFCSLLRIPELGRGWRVLTFDCEQEAIQVSALPSLIHCTNLRELTFKELFTLGANDALLFFTELAKLPALAQFRIESFGGSASEAPLADAVSTCLAPMARAPCLEVFEIGELQNAVTAFDTDEFIDPLLQIRTLHTLRIPGFALADETMRSYVPTCTLDAHGRLVGSTPLARVRHLHVSLITLPDPTALLFATVTAAAAATTATASTDAVPTAAAAAAMTVVAAAATAAIAAYNATKTSYMILEGVLSGPQDDASSFVACGQMLETLITGRGSAFPFLEELVVDLTFDGKTDAALLYPFRALWFTPLASLRKLIVDTNGVDPSDIALAGRINALRLHERGLEIEWRSQHKPSRLSRLPAQF